LLGRLKVPVLAVLLVGVLNACDRQAEPWNATDISGVMPDLEFALTDENGEPAKAEQFRGKVTAVFFGFTHCPDICPTTLGTLSQVIAELPKEQQDEVGVLFVSVDPDRDTPEILREYTDHFGPQFTGLTGTQKALKSLVKQYRVTYGYGEKDTQGNYDVSHSSAVYLFDREGKARLLVRGSDKKAGIAEDLQRLIED
jgi:protein SCO1/2